MEEIIKKNFSNQKVPTLLIHSCCAPCSSYCLELLSSYFKITVFYYNPNIYPAEEYQMRSMEQKRFCESFPGKYPITFVEGKYDTNEFYEMAKGLEQAKEGGERCYKCYELRLRKTCEYAKAHDFDFFTTTLSISPMKNAKWLNEIGGKLEEEYKISYLYSDFKKKNGYKRSTEISNEYGMYRQYYCGCVYSKTQRDKEIEEKNLNKEDM
jgi:predicted adenine nucleotide alpha hydrolase (AANH) superfamily ATPase